MPTERDNSLVLRLKGGRFNDGSIPLPVLPSFTQLGALIADIAWQQYAEETGAKRRTNAFNDALDLRLTDVVAGSAVAIIRPSSPQPSLKGFGPYDRFRELGIERVHDVVSVAEGGGDAGIVIKPELLARFDNILPDLRDDESVEFPSSSGPQANYAVMTHITRDRIVKAARVKTIVDKGELYAFVPEINKRTNSFELQAVDGSIRKKVKFDDPHFDALKDAWESYRRDLAAGNPVRVVGSMEFSHHETIRNIINVDAIETLDPFDVRARLRYISSLRDGWFNGSGSKFQDHYLGTLADRFDRWYSEQLPKPAIFPHADGTIGCEWTLHDGECILTVDPHSDKGEWIDFNPSDEEDETERTLDLAIADSWKWFAERVVARNAGAAQ